MIKSDFHTHTIYCDGESIPREMVESAISKGMDSIGIAVHSYTFFDESYCIKKEKINEFEKEINSLKKEYKSKINVLCGIEQDFYSDIIPVGYDYVIGSVHYLKVKNDYFPIDETREMFIDEANKYYNGDMYAFCDDYYKTIAKLPDYVDIIGHFDLISKFNENNCLFDENDFRYVSAYKKAIEGLAKLNIPFEINSGAVSKGYKTSYYPSVKQLEYIKKCGCSVILSSDSHCTDTLCNKFEEMEKTALDLGLNIEFDLHRL